MECNVGHNVGHLERVIRITLGITLLAIGGLTALPIWGTFVTLVVGIIALVSGMMGFCPAWRILGMNTCHRDHAKNS
ncbi:MAG: YgaP family membrane protein [Nitrospirales bacterium]